MQPDDIIRLLQRQPFVPFRIHLTDGAHYDVPHREFAWVDRSAVHLAVLRGGKMPWDAPIERIVDIALLHIVRIEPVEPNGWRRRSA